MRDLSSVDLALITPGQTFLLREASFRSFVVTELHRRYYLFADFQKFPFKSEIR